MTGLTLRLTAAFVWFLTFVAAEGSAAVFQFSLPVATAKGTNRAWLWIPPAAPQVRGVVMAGMTLMEREFVTDEVIRRACADEQLAIVFLNCGLSAQDIPKLLAKEPQQANGRLPSRLIAMEFRPPCLTRMYPFTR